MVVERRARRRTRLLTPATVADLPAPCSGCTVWEAGVLRPGGDLEAKRAWVRRVTGEWGPCGRVLDVDGVPVGYLCVAPAAYVVGPSIVSLEQISPDAVCLAGLRVADPQQRVGLGRVLVQAVVKDLLARRDVRAIEAFGWTGPGEGGCLTPVGFLTGVGFTVVQPHPWMPRLRLDLRRVLPTVTDAEAAWVRIKGAVGHVRPPSHAPETDPPPARRDADARSALPPGVG